MDNKDRQKQTTDDDNIANIQQSKVKNTDSTSRFSRRRFIRSAVITSPILLSVKSPVSWGGGLYDGQCSIVSQLSGNASHPHNCQTRAKNPLYWMNTFIGDNEIVNQELEKRGCYATTPFHELFPHHLRNYTMQRRMSKNWRYRVNPDTENPTLLQCLSRTDTSFWLEFENTESEEKVHINVLDGVANFHCYMTAGYLNGLFHPSPINYIGNEVYVQKLFTEALYRSVNTILWDLEKNRFSRTKAITYSQAMLNVRTNLNRWDSV
ncbi:hypothetical protein [Vibrio alfacsensis]|uniref:hypothetical protein n=1 Tax=Vibrio alfacsensis TaxID=1074311 RepID=UPI00406796DB